MEHIQSIEEYIAADKSGKITRKNNSPLTSLLVLAVGIALIVMITKVHLGDAPSLICLTVGLIATAVGIILTAMNFSGALYHYETSGNRMKDSKVYLSVDDYRKATEALSGSDLAPLGKLHPVNSSNNGLRILISTDGSIALVQPLHDESGHLSPSADVRCLQGTDVVHIKPLCK